MTLQKGHAFAAAVVVGGTAIVLTILKRKHEQIKKPSDPIVSTWVVSKTIVKATNLENNKEELREPLSEVDEWLSRSSHWLPFCLRFDAVLDETQVQLGLERTLTHIPALGARIDTGTNKLQYEVVLDNSNAGIPFEVVHGMVLSGSTGETKKLPDGSSTRKEWQEAGLDAPSAGFSGEPGIHDPMMRARLTIFKAEKVSYLSIGISHGLGDGHSIADVLQVWSHFCTNTSPQGLPPNLVEPKVFGKRITQPQRPAKDTTELYKRIKNDVGYDVNPLSIRTLFKLLPGAIWCMSRQRVLELRLDGDQIAKLKDSITKSLPEGEWVSRFEVVCAVLLLVQRVTSSAKTTSPDHKLHVACNLRGRIDRFPKDYFGNAAFDYCENLSLPVDAFWTLPSLVKFAHEVHRGLRRGLEHPEDITKTKDWFEAARHLGLRNRFDIWPLAFDTFQGKGTFVNSWGPRWLDVSMGATVKASAMMAYSGIAQNLIVEVPRTQDGDTSVYLALPPQHAWRFIEFCKSPQNDPPLPFSVVGNSA